MVIKIIQLKMLFLLLSIWSTTLFCHIASENKNIPQKNTQRLNEEIKRSQSVEQPVNQPPGRAVYAKYCLTCHQSNGSGVPGMNPPLGQGSWVGKDAKDLINLLLNGQT